MRPVAAVMRPAAAPRPRRRLARRLEVSVSLEGADPSLNLGLLLGEVLGGIQIRREDHTPADIEWRLAPAVRGKRIRLALRGTFGSESWDRCGSNGI